MGDLLAAAEILTSVQAVGGKRLAIITNGGGAGVLAADRAGDLGIALPDLSSATMATLDAVLPPFWSRRNPIDILGDATADHYRAAIEACATDSSFDATLVLLSPQAMTDAKRVAEAIRHGAVGGTKPVLACLLGERSVHSARRALETARVPSFVLPERAVEAFAYLVQHRAAQRSLAAAPVRTTEGPAPPEARAVIDAARREDRQMLSDLESKTVLMAFGIPCVLPRPAATRDEATTLAREIGAPVALKISSPDISHKSDVGGVRLGLSADEVGRAFDDVMARATRLRPQARLNGVTVEPIAGGREARELLIGLKTDPVFGPVVTFGAGGTMVEVLADTAVALPPLDRSLARNLVGRTRIFHALVSFRDLRAVDMDAVLDALVAVSELSLALTEVVSMDINPLFAGPDAAIVVDVRIELRARGSA